MTWSYTLGKHYKVKERKTYPWPCQANADRTLELSASDVLTKSADGTMTKRNGLLITGIMVPSGEMEEVFEPVRLRVGS